MRWRRRMIYRRRKAAENRAVLARYILGEAVFTLVVRLEDHVRRIIGERLNRAVVATPDIDAIMQAAGFTTGTASTPHSR